jgi:GAF domain-containing protein
MFNGILNFFASPDDKDEGFIRLTRNILIFSLVTTLLSSVIVALTSTSRGRVIIISVLIVASLIEAFALFLVGRGKLTLAKVAVPVALVLAITIIASSADSMHSISIVAYPLIIIIATLLQGRRSLVVTTPLTMLAIAFLGIMDMAGLSTSPMRVNTDLEDILTGIVLIAASAAILNLLVERLRVALAKAEANEQAQGETNRELTNLKISLEQRVAERTNDFVQRSTELEAVNRQVRRRAAQLEALAQVAHTVASVRDLRQLLPQIATAISEKFGFYHVGVFLLDEANEYAVLSATNSEGGKKMLDRKHRLRVGQEGIVGNVTHTGEARMAMDVGKDAVFFDNAELPDTHSELALPLKSENRIVGAVDVQSTERGAFTNEDVQMLSLLADQVSLAIENARLFDETRAALTEAEATSRQFTREAWGRIPQEHRLLGYRYNVAGAVPLDELVDISEPGKGKNRDHQKKASQTVVPIELRGETIGTLVVQSPSTDGLNQEQINLIRAVAERVALSAENARLFEETTRRAERERLVSDITGKIRSVNDPQTMIQTAMEELRKALGASHVEVIPQAVKGAE